MGATSSTGESGRRELRVVGLGASEWNDPDRARERGCKVSDWRFVGEPSRAAVGRLGDSNAFPPAEPDAEGLAGLAARGDEGVARTDLVKLFVR